MHMSASPRRRPAQPTVTAVIPTYNEAANLTHLLPELPPLFEVIVVDGGSSDGTVETARQVMPTVRALQQTRRGKGNALACGFRAARGDIIVMVDADGSADPAEIERFVAALRAGADFAKGSRRLGGSNDITRLRGTGNRMLTTFTNVLFGTRYTDLCYGYNAFWRDILPALELPAVSPTGEHMVWGDGFEIETLLNCRIAKAGLIVTEVASFERARVHGVSNLAAHKDGLRVLRTLLTERRRAAAPDAGPDALSAELDEVIERADQKIDLAAAEQDLAPVDDSPPQP